MEENQSLESELEGKLFRAKQAHSTEKVIAEIKNEKGTAEVWGADLVNPANIPLLSNRAEKAFGTVDILVNNAAHYTADTFIPKSQLQAVEF